YSTKALDSSVHPALTVVYGAAPQAPPPTATGKLRVLQYNTHHGGWGTDGVWSPSRIVDWIIKANPDIVSLQEIEVGTSWSQNQDDTVIYQNLLQQRTGHPWYKMFSKPGQWGVNGNLIL